MSETPHGDAYDLVLSVYRKSPGKSWRRLNSALHHTLSAAMVGHLSFMADDFAAIYRDSKGGYWMGNSEGSVTGERYYTMAVKCAHTQACISFENYAGRPAALWRESVNTPERLCIGKRMTWRGTLLDVTSMRTDHLIACSYLHMEREFGEGSQVYLDGGYHIVERLSRLESGIVVHFSKEQDGYRDHGRKPDRVVRITYAELTAERKRANGVRKAALHDVAAAENIEALSAVKERIAAAPMGTYRKFDINDIRDAIQEREQVFRRY